MVEEVEEVPAQQVELLILVMALLEVVLLVERASDQLLQEQITEAEAEEVMVRMVPLTEVLVVLVVVDKVEEEAAREQP
jgi:hypothetical protein